MFLQLLVRISVGMLVYGSLIIGPAWLMTGSPDWPRGWLALAALFGMQLSLGLWLLKADPDLLRERMSVPTTKSWADRFATILIILVMFGWFILTAIDVHRLHLLPSLPPSVSLWIGPGLYVLGVFTLVWIFRENSFAAPVVKIQEEREQYVIDTGPYAFVRHPMYTSIILLFAGLGLIMESSASALAAVPMVVIGFLPRMITEEATLRRELAGYDEYMSRVRWRLVPGVF